MTDEIDEGGDAACWAHVFDDLDQPTFSLEVRSSNTIIYCDPWVEVVDFYRNGLGLQTTMARDWFVEFLVHPGAHVSVADASRASVAAGTGDGLTLSWAVDDVDATAARLTERRVEVSKVFTRWGSRCCVVIDPAGNRIELWSPPSNC